LLDSLLQEIDGDVRKGRRDRDIGGPNIKSSESEVKEKGHWILNLGR